MKEIPISKFKATCLAVLETVRKTGKPLVILEMAGIGLDIDHPQELELLLLRVGDTHAQQLLRAWKYRPTPATQEAAG